MPYCLPKSSIAVGFVALSLSGLGYATAPSDDAWSVAINTTSPTSLYNHGVYDRNGTNSWDWVNNKIHGNTNSFDQLQTFQLGSAYNSATKQYDLAPMDPNTTLTLTPPTSDAADTCAELFYQDKQAFVPLKTPVNLLSKFPSLNGLPNNTTPVHLTAIPYAGDCSKAPATLNANQILAIWDAAYKEIPTAPTNAIYCALSGTITSDDLPLNSTQPEPAGAAKCPGLVKPQWRMVKSTDASSTATYFLEFTGPLHDLLAQNPQQPLDITLSNNADIQFPITTEYVKYPTLISDDTEMAACTAALNTYNAQTSLAKKPQTFPFKTCGLVDAVAPSPSVPSKILALYNKSSDDYQRSYTYSEPMSQPIYVNGFGKIDGSMALSDYKVNPFGSSYAGYRPCKLSVGYGSIAPCVTPGTIVDKSVEQGSEYISYAQWRIETSLLGLSSEFSKSIDAPTRDPNNPAYQGANPAIYIQGVAVVNTPKRNRSVVQANVAQFGLENNREADNTPVVMNDVKQVGAWLDASDGPDIGSDSANEQNLYYQINDDSAKLEAQKQYVHNVTLLQGGVGGIMVGMYGVTRDGVDNAKIDGVYVPRIIKEPFYNPSNPKSLPGWAAYSATSGLITTRTCPRYFQNGSTVTPSLGNATIQNVKVFALSADASWTDEPNSIDGLVSMGIAADSPYCSVGFDTQKLAPDYTFGPFFINNIESDITPDHTTSDSSGVSYATTDNAFVFYNAPIGFDPPHAKTMINWQGIHFNTDVNNSVKYLSAANMFNYACPLSSDMASLKCMQWVASTQKAIALTKNVQNINVLTPFHSPIPVFSTTTYPAQKTDGQMASVEDLYAFGLQMENEMGY